MREKKTEKKSTSRRGRWWLLFFVILIVVLGWLAYKYVGFNNIKQYVASDVQQVVEEQVVAEVKAEEGPVQPVSAEEFKPACKVVEDILLKDIPDDEDASYNSQIRAGKIYDVLAKRGCPENSQFFADMAMRRRMIAESLSDAYGNSTDNTVNYLYSNAEICQTIEDRLLQSINTEAFIYREYLNNAKVFSVLYEYGCTKNKPAYMKATLRELGVAVALMPTDKMQRDEIITVVEICKSLGVAEVAHLMLQRLKARGYDREFILEMEDIIHSIR